MVAHSYALRVYLESAGNNRAACIIQHHVYEIYGNYWKWKLIGTSAFVGDEPKSVSIVCRCVGFFDVGFRVVVFSRFSGTMTHRTIVLHSRKFYFRLVLFILSSALFFDGPCCVCVSMDVLGLFIRSYDDVL